MIRQSAPRLQMFTASMKTAARPYHHDKPAPPLQGSLGRMTPRVLPQKSALRHRYRQIGLLKKTKLKLKVTGFQFPTHLVRSEGHISGFSPSPPFLAPPITVIPVVRRRATERPRSTRASPDRHRRPLRVGSGEGELQKHFRVF